MNHEWKFISNYTFEITSLHIQIRSHLWKIMEQCLLCNNFRNVVSDEMALPSHGPHIISCHRLMFFFCFYLLKKLNLFTSKAERLQILFPVFELAVSVK